MRKCVWALLMVVSVGLVFGGAVEAKAGSKIAFYCDSSTPGEASGQLCVSNPDGSELTQITHVPDTGQSGDSFLMSGDSTAWSPDGTQVAAIGHGAGESLVMVFNVDGTFSHEFPLPMSAGYGLSWSPELPAQVSAISVGGTYALVFMMGVMAALIMVSRQERQGIESGQLWI